MRIYLSELQHYAPIQTLIVRSLDGSLYQALVVIDHEERLVYEHSHQALKAYSSSALLNRFEGIAIQSIQLRHQSAYDEMIGQPWRKSSNQLEVPLRIDGTRISH